MKKAVMTMTLTISALVGFGQETTSITTSEGKQVLAKSPYKSFQLYAGDVLKFEVNGENKKFDVHSGAGYGWSDIKKVNDITTHTITISKEGIYTIGWIAGPFKKVSEVSLIRIPAPGKENASTVAGEDKERISIKENNIYKGSTAIGAFTMQKIGATDLYKVTNAAGTYVAKFVATTQPATAGPAYKKIELYKGFDVLSTATPIKVLENTNFDRPDQMRDKAIRWLIENNFL